MIDPIGMKKIEAVRMQPRSAADQPAQPAPVQSTSQPGVDTADARMLAIAADAARGDAPIDQDKVEQLRAKIADGSYSLNPKALANAMLGFASEGLK